MTKRLRLDTSTPKWEIGMNKQEFHNFVLKVSGKSSLMKDRKTPLRIRILYRMLVKTIHEFSSSPEAEFKNDDPKD